MQTTITINTDRLNSDFIEHVKYLYPNKEVDITVLISDATDFINSNPAYLDELQERIKEYEARR